MMNDTKTLRELISFKKDCIFCNQKLAIILVNAYDSHYHFLDICPFEATLEGDQFYFNLKGHDPDGKYGLNINICINIDDNRLCFYFCEKNSISVGNDIYKIFMDLRPVVQLVCKNMNCNTDYYLESEYLHLDSNAHIGPSYMDLESFRFNKWRIVNYNDTYAFHTSIYGEDSNELRCDYIDFGFYVKRKIIQ